MAEVGGEIILARELKEGIMILAPERTIHTQQWMTSDRVMLLKVKGRAALHTFFHGAQDTDHAA